MVMNYCEGHDKDEDVDNECDDVLDADDDDIAVLDCVFLNLLLLRIVEVRDEELDDGMKDEFYWTEILEFVEFQEH